jgi:hypothetical protein
VLGILLARKCQKYGIWIKYQDSKADSISLKRCHHQKSIKSKMGRQRRLDKKQNSILGCLIVVPFQNYNFEKIK